MTEAAGVVQVVLVDRRGWVLMQERDEYAAADPNRWGLVGGGIEPGESEVDAAHRELDEETRLRAELVPLGTHTVACQVHGEDTVALFTGRTSAVDADVVCGEGRQIVFVDPTRIPALDLTDAARSLVPVALAAQG
jgi:8-oxo-dGTP pyrophosphatase MutT (NUDIX family)